MFKRHKFRNFTYPEKFKEFKSHHIGASYIAYIVYFSNIKVSLWYHKKVYEALKTKI